MKIACWNVNSVRARLARLIEFLERAQPDILCLQETKCEDAGFPFEAIGDAGYEVAHYGQKSYNGVAVLSKKRALQVQPGFADGAPEDGQSRLLWARFETVTVASVYAPNGQAVGSDKYAYKLQWFERLARLLQTKSATPGMLVVCGDYNVAPADLDVYDPAGWGDAVLCSPAERQAFRALLETGLKDGFRTLYPDTQAFTWWDYRMLGFQKNRGLRIDHFLLNAPALAGAQSITVDRESRKGQDPSDHAPIILTVA